MEMTPKQIRTVDKNMATLFRQKELMTDSQALYKFDLFERCRREIKTTEGRSLFLTDNAFDSFSKIVDRVDELLPSRAFLECEDVDRACRVALGNLYIEEGPLKDFDSFLLAVDKIVTKSIKTYRFYTSLDGLDIDGFNEFSIGKLAVVKPEMQVLRRCNVDEDTAHNIWNNMQGGLWITGEVKGSFAYAERVFFEDAKAASGLLAVSLTTVLERGAAAIRLIPSMEGHMRPSSVSWFSFTTEPMTLCHSAILKSHSVSLNKHTCDDMLDCAWFKDLTKIIQDRGETDAVLAVQRSIYWFFDAQADTMPEMQFVKFWSCIECIFSFEKAGGTTRKITKGLSALLTCGRYKFSQIDSRSKLEKDIGNLYDMRCSAVHDARHGHVNGTHVSKVSKWAAWTILEVTSLIAKGCETRAEIKEAIEQMKNATHLQHDSVSESS